MQFFHSLKSFFRNNKRNPQQRTRARLLLEHLEDRVTPSTIVVDTLVDESLSNSQTSLREAIVQANNLAGHDTIEFDESLYGVINLTKGQLALTDDLAILGDARITIDAHDTSRIFLLGQDVTADLDSMTLTGGYADTGGFTGDLGGAIFLDTCSTLNLTNSTLFNNYADDSGGAIFVSGCATAKLTNSTLSGNQADDFGGAIFVALDANVVSTHTTITGNRANADGWWFGAGGGMYVQLGGDVHLSHTIVAGNFVQTGTFADDLSGITLTVTGSYNLIGDANTAGGLVHDVLHNIVGAGGVGTIDIDMVLDTTLSFNGGNLLTHALVEGSLALNSGAPNHPDAPDHDQRGLARVVGTIDIGSVEVQAETLVVDSLLDEVDGDYSEGNFTFREAVEIANADPGKHIITFDAAVFFPGQNTIVMEMGQFTLSDDVSIRGRADMPIIFDAQGNSRIFEITPNTDVDMEYVMLIGGHAHAGGATGDLGGAIFADSGSSLQLSNVTIADNTADGSGGGIYAAQGSSVNTAGVTLSGNVAQDEGGAMFVEGFAIVNLGQSTITGNQAGSGGGIFLAANSNASPRNSIVAANFLSNGVTPHDIAGAGSLDGSSAFNLIGNANTAGGLQDGVNGNIVGNNGTGTIDINTVLETQLADNGGGMLTHALVEGSAAINAADPNFDPNATDPAQTHDQRGMPRMLGRLDMGAVEMLVVDTVVDELDGDYSQGDVSLREMVALSNAMPGTQKILFDAEAFPDGQSSTIALNAVFGELALEDDVEIRGLGSDRIRVDAGGHHRHFNVQPSVTADILGLTLANGNASLGGSILTSAGSNVTLGDVCFEDNQADRGGAMYVADAAQVTIDASCFVNNSANDHGGAIAATGGSSLVVSDSTFSLNQASENGAAIFAQNANHVSVTSSTFENNHAGERGGAIFTLASPVSIHNSTFHDNSADDTGGAVHAVDATVSITLSNLTGNNAHNGGGAILAHNGSLSIVDTTLHYNWTNAAGGALLMSGQNNAYIGRSTLSSNVALDRGGAVFAAGQQFTTQNVTFSSNLAFGQGGAIYAASTNMALTHSTITNNRGGGAGGVALHSSANAFIRNSIVVGNLNRNNNTFHDIDGAVRDHQTAYNIIGSAYAAGGIQNGRHGNIVGAYVLDVLDTTLRDNGGPTLTHALVANSLARNAGDPSFNGAIMTDQRGHDRVNGGRLDIGAVEM